MQNSNTFQNILDSFVSKFDNLGIDAVPIKRKNPNPRVDSFRVQGFTGYFRLSSLTHIIRYKKCGCHFYHDLHPTYFNKDLEICPICLPDTPLGSAINAEHFCYLIRFEFEDQAFYKIGYSKDPLSRKKGVFRQDVHNEVIHYESFTTETDARYYELRFKRLIHRYLDTKANHEFSGCQKYIKAHKLTTSGFTECVQVDETIITLGHLHRHLLAKTPKHPLLTTALEFDWYKERVSIPDSHYANLQELRAGFHYHDSDISIDGCSNLLTKTDLSKFHTFTLAPHGGSTT